MQDRKSQTERGGLKDIKQGDGERERVGGCVQKREKEARETEQMKAVMQGRRVVV